MTILIIDGLYAHKLKKVSLRMKYTVKTISNISKNYFIFICTFNGSYVTRFADIKAIKM